MLAVADKFCTKKLTVLPIIRLVNEVYCYVRDSFEIESFVEDKKKIKIFEVFYLQQ